MKSMLKSAYSIVALCALIGIIILSMKPDSKVVKEDKISTSEVAADSTLLVERI